MFEPVGIRDAFADDFAAEKIHAADEVAIFGHSADESVVGDHLDVAIRDIGERLRRRPRVRGGHVGDAIMRDVFFHENGT